MNVLQEVVWSQTWELIKQPHNKAKFHKLNSVESIIEYKLHVLAEATASNIDCPSFNICIT